MLNHPRRNMSGTTVAWTILECRVLTDTLVTYRLIPTPVTPYFAPCCEPDSPRLLGQVASCFLCGKSAISLLTSSALGQRYVCSASSNGKVYVYDLNSTKLVCVYEPLAGGTEGSGMSYLPLVSMCMSTDLTRDNYP